MDEAKQMLVSQWLFKSQRDLASARRLADASDPLLDTAFYHCQQAAEKAVKAFLVFHDIRVPKSHDLEELIVMAGTRTSNYAALGDAAKRLTQYEQAFQEATQFVGIALALIPADAHPAA